MSQHGPGQASLLSALAARTSTAKGALTELEAWALTCNEAQTGPYGIPAGEVPITL